MEKHAMKQRTLRPYAGVGALGDAYVNRRTNGVILAGTRGRFQGSSVSAAGFQVVRTAVATAPITGDVCPRSGDPAV